MKRILLIFAAFAPCVAGCVDVPKLRQADVTPPAAYEAPQPSPNQAAPVTLDRWWSLYGDTQLETLVELALTNAPDAKDALSKLVQADAIRAGNADQLYIPQSTLSGTATRTHTDILSSTGGIGGFPGFTVGGDTTSLNGTFSATWELDLFGRRGAASRTINADFYTAGFTYEATRTSLAANVAQSLFQVRGLYLQLQDSTETARVDRDLLRIVQTKVDRGLSASADLDQAQANAETADAQAESLKAQLAAAQRALLVLVGKGFDPLQSLSPSTPIGTPPPVPAEVPGDLLRRRPDVRQAEWKIVSAAGTLKVDQLALLPTLKINPGVTLAKSTGPFGSSSAAWSVGSSLTAPVLDRPRLIAQIHAQRAVAEQAIIAYEKAVQTAYGDAETAFTYLDSDTRRVALLAGAEKHADTAYERARIGYARGYNDLQTALTAETTWRNIRTQLSSAQSTQMQRSVQVFKALGGGWSPEAPAAGTPFAGRAARGAEGGR